MLEAKRKHSAVSMNTITFMISGQENNNSWEVFDCFSRNFVSNFFLNLIVCRDNEVYFLAKK